MAKVDKGKSALERLKKYRKFYSKDSARQLRKLDKYYDRKTDSLTKVNRKQQRLCDLARRKGLPCAADTLKQLKGYASLMSKDSTLLDSLGNEIKTTGRDNLTEQLPPGQREKLEGLQNKYGSQSKEVNQYLTLLRDSVSVIDTVKSMAFGKAEALGGKMAEDKLGSSGAVKELREYEKTVKDLKATPDQYKNKLDEVQDKEKLKAEAKEKALEKATEMMADNVDKFKPVQKQMGLMKGKYSSLLNSNDLSTGVKARSLEGRPLRERWIIGGNFNIPSTAPLMIDLSPQFGYRIDKAFQIGVGGIYRATFTDSVKFKNAPPASVYGYSLFAKHELFYNFFAYAEWERANREFKSSTRDGVSRIWVDNLLVGVGRKFALHKKLNASLLFLWNPLHENGKSTYPNAFVIKTGVHLSELALLKK
jgi:hypothetical protein